MITFSKLGEHGRLGNQLYQYCFLYYCKKKYNYEACIPFLDNKYWHGQKCLLNKFNISIKEKDIVTTNLFKEGDPILLDDSDIIGFFQDKKYFEEYKEEIITEFKLKENRVVPNLYKDTPCIHIRLGDNIRENKEHYFNSILGKNYRNYVMDTILSIKSKDLIVLTGGARSNEEKEIDLDINICKSFLKVSGKNLIFSKNINPLDDLSIMINTKELILSPLSTFSIWAGYLSKGKVYAYKDFYLDNRNHNLYLDNWII